MNSQVIVEGPRGFYVGVQAELIDDQKEMAWAEDHIVLRPDFGWLVGRYVETDKANENGHIFGLEEIVARHHTIVNTPLNMLHRTSHVIGTFAATKLIVPDNAMRAAAGDSALLKPHVEALAAFWRYAFPDDYQATKAAYEMGACWYSMECVPASLTCPVDNQTFPYRGVRSDTYCAHINQPRGHRRLNEPHFVGGAVIVPPIRPGWKRADISELAGIIEANLDEAERVYEQVAAASPWLDGPTVEGLMAQLLAGAYGSVPAVRHRSFSVPERRRLVEEGKALPDASFPIETVFELRSSIASFAWTSKNKPEVRKHIIRRARALGRTDLIPDRWAAMALALHDADSTPPDAVRDAYLAHLKSLDMESEVDKPAASAHPLSDGTTLWELADGWGEWYFHEADGKVRWVAQKWPDVHAFFVADGIPIGKPEVKAMGMGNAAWVKALAAVLAPVAKAELDDYQLLAALETAAGQQGAMVALVPPPEIREALAAAGAGGKGSQPADEIHCTLAFLGDLDAEAHTVQLRQDEDGAVDPVPVSRLEGALAAFCAGAPPLPQAQVSGMGRFAQPDGTYVLYASVDVPGLSELRERLVAALEAAGVHASALHGFTPHITLRYTRDANADTQLPDGLTWPVTHLELWVGGEHQRFELHGGKVTLG